MKRLVALILLCFLGLSAYNFWEIHELRQEVAQLQSKVQAQQSSGLSDALVVEAAAQFAKAKEALSSADVQTARQALASAERKVEEAGRTAGEKAGPMLDWARRQAADLQKRIEAGH